MVVASTPTDLSTLPKSATQNASSAGSHNHFIDVAPFGVIDAAIFNGLQGSGGVGNTATTISPIVGANVGDVVGAVVGLRDGDVVGDVVVTVGVVVGEAGAAAVWFVSG